MTALSCLVVDDDPAMRMLTTVQLRAIGGHVVEAATGAEGHRILTEDGPFRLVLADRVLPGEASGTVLLREASGNGHAVECFLMTAHVDETVRAEAEAIGATAIDKLDLEPVLQRWTEMVAGG